MEGRGKFGYNVESLGARQLLIGYSKFRKGFQDALHGICEQITHICNIVPQDLIESIITKKIWQEKWKKKKETSSLVLTLHVGHYILRVHSDQISNFHAFKSSLAFVHDIAKNGGQRDYV